VTSSLGNQKVLAIYREPIFSHNAIEADRLILEESMQALEAKFKEHKTPHEIQFLEAQEWTESASQFTPKNTVQIFSMAQGASALGALRSAEDSGISVTNSVESILSCYRTRMTPMLTGGSVGYPKSQIIYTNDLVANLNFSSTDGYWVKRGDVHATTSEDVVFYETAPQAIDAVKLFKKRNIESVVIQEHIPGNIYKFYWVAGGYFTARLVHSSINETIPFEMKAMEACAALAAKKMHLQVCGGDCIVTKDGTFHIIDLNDWPSFRTCRDTASVAIANFAFNHIQNLNSDPTSNNLH